MEKNVWRVGGATALYLGIHSLLAGRGVKKAAERLLGGRRRNGLYRASYTVISVAGLAALLRLLAWEPGRDVYRVPRPWALGMRIGQAASFVYMAAGVGRIGLRRFLGVSSLAAWLKGTADVPREPEAQGPALDDEGRLRVAGPFRSSRHPMNFAQLCLLWLSPRMTTGGLAFTTIVTLYTIITSRNEETRLREAYCSVKLDFVRSREAKSFINASRCRAG